MDKADELADIAVQLVTRVRDDEPDAVHRWLASVVDPADWMGLCVVLACAVPDDKPWKLLTAWTWTLGHGDGGPDTPDVVLQRRIELDLALNGPRRQGVSTDRVHRSVHRLSGGLAASDVASDTATSVRSAVDGDPHRTAA